MVTNWARVTELDRSRSPEPSPDRMPSTWMVSTLALSLTARAPVHSIDRERERASREEKRRFIIKKYSLRSWQVGGKPPPFLE